MKSRDLKCVVCGGNLVYEDTNKSYHCSKCNASIDPKVFSVSKDQSEKKRKWTIKRIRLFIAVLGALYLLWLIYRILI